MNGHLVVQGRYVEELDNYKKATLQSKAKDYNVERVYVILPNGNTVWYGYNGTDEYTMTDSDGMCIFTDQQGRTL